MHIKVKDIAIDLNLYGMRTEILYENRNNKALDLSNMTTKMITELFYCVVVANLEKKKLDVLSFDEFLAEIEDKNEGDKTMMDFWIWYVKTKAAQNEQLFKDVENDVDLKKNLTK